MPEGHAEFANDISGNRQLCVVNYSNEISCWDPLKNKYEDIMPKYKINIKSVEVNE